MTMQEHEIIRSWSLSKGLIKPLLEKLGEEWIESSYGNDETMSIAFYYKDHELKLYLPNSNFNDPDIELWSTFSLIHLNENLEWQTEHTKENIASLEDAIQECIKQSKLIKEKF
tara:strand:+ start:356 stop:697 length:342 start_codon:yes stop_codon:yes gene_type:complete